MTIKRTILALHACRRVCGAAFARAWPKSKMAPPQLKWSFAGPFGKYDEAQLQRGFKIYKEVCSVCHSLQLLSFRNLAEPGGPASREAQAAAVAAEYKIKDLDDKGEPTRTAGRLADHFPSPFPNELAAKAAARRRAAGHVDARQGAHLSARLPLVRVRLLHAVSGARPRLHRGAI